MKKVTRADRRLTFRRRTLLGGWLLAAGVLVWRAGQIQIAEGATWRAQAESQQRMSAEVVAARGSVVDRNRVELALSRETYRVSVAPHELEDADAVAELLAASLDMRQATVRRATHSDARWRVLPGSYPPSVREALMGLTGVYLERELQRFYPQGELARGLLGVVIDGRGAGGVEQAFDELLQGRAGRDILARDNSGKPIPGAATRVEEPQPGNHVVLTIDLELQEIAREALSEAVASTQAEGGDLLVTDPRTGDILAMVSLRDGSTASLSAINTPYEPGSILKPFTVAGLLEHGLATLEDEFDTGDGTWEVAGRKISDTSPRKGILTLGEAIRVSSNVAVAKAAQSLTPSQQYQVLRDFGFGAPAGIGLAGEVAGTLRRPDQWSLQSPASLAIGYEIAVTPLQMAMAYGALANGGTLMAPRLVTEIRDPDGHVIRRFEPRTVRRVVRKSVTRRLVRALVDVVEDGTGSGARLSTLSVAGKSGTSRAVGSDGRYEKGAYFASFVGFVPAENPQLVVLVKLDRPRGASYYGGSTAAPVSRATMEAILAAGHTPLGRGALARATELSPRPEPVRFASLQSPISSNQPVRSQPSDDAAAVPVPALEGLTARSAARRLHAMGFRVILKGSGHVSKTMPEAGVRIARGDTVRVWVRGLDHE
ncbi:MAG: PASTA domain-containing protein [Gemmatimonadetes bacterium]|nr:PASTA domain-containing protein [Gemmatimonadota bacterium]